MANASTDGPNWVSTIQLPDHQTGSTESTQKFAECAHQTHKTTNNKRIIVCCDGTWNNSNEKGLLPTNVARLSAAVAHKCCTGMPQVVYYHRGAGTDSSKIGKYLGGVFGKGVIEDIADIYRFIGDNYNPGDEIIILGFSRGAFTARSVSGLICSIGLLNRVGMSQFAAIFHDYQNFANWKPGMKFNKDKHLVGFTLSNLERLKKIKKDTARRSNAELEEELINFKTKIFNSMAEHKGETDQQRLRQMAQFYRQGLVEHEMILRKMMPDNNWVPTEVKVKAVGVWDTVGSLGWPKMPWEKIRKNRSAEELRFTSLDVHPMVEHAFHALALDEWRTTFAPTLWGMKDNKNQTKLRQVWFPGSHSNVGGGIADQQIATIAMAWMADQLTSIGVEFSTPEMRRLFYTLEPDAKPCDWALGRISSPKGVTSFPDQAYNAFWYPWQRIKGANTILSTRTPGNYKEDGGNSLITDTNEFIHPSVRIRYLNKGPGLDDEGEWDCPALTGNGFKLDKDTKPPKPEHSYPNGYPNDPIASTYETLSGKVSSVHFGHSLDTESHKDHTLVVHQMPFEKELFPLDQAKNYWFWKAEDTGKIIPEERIGMWERFFIKVNIQMVEAQRDKEAAKKASSSGQSKKWSLRGLVYDRYQSAKGLAGKILSGTVGKLLGSQKPPKPSVSKEIGYHDMISWQRGAMAKPRPGKP